MDETTYPADSPRVPCEHRTRLPHGWREQHAAPTTESF